MSERTAQIPRSLQGTRKALDSGGTVSELVTHALSSIAAAPIGDPFLETFNDLVTEQAARVDQRLKAGNAGPLAGLVLGIKDNICIKGQHVSAASQMLKGFRSLYTATAMERLIAADAVIIGRTNCDEFAMGSSNENSAYGTVSNPHDPARVSGGSSGGSAAAVAMGMCQAALGSDTGGSIRQPASFCGVVGFKPTYGRVSRYGLIAFASSFDQIGPFASNVEDAANIYEVMAGKDPRDSTTTDRPVERTLFNEPRKLKIAWYRECIEREGLAPEIKQAVVQVLERMREEGHKVEAVDLPMLDQMVPTYYVLTTAEASSNLARFDGVHYGYHSPVAEGVEETYVLSRSEGFGKEVQRRIMLGTFVLSAGYYDAYYAKAQRVRRMIRDEAISVLSKYDVVITPTCPMTAFRKGQLTGDPIAMYLQDIFTVQANLVGSPAISIPLGKDKAGLPFGLQLMARPYAEVDMLSAAHQVETILASRA